MLLSALKRRWPVLTTVLAALYYVVTNYDIRGLEGLRLEPRSSANSQTLPGYANNGFNWPTNTNVSPTLPPLGGGLPNAGANPWASANMAGYSPTASSPLPSTSGSFGTSPSYPGLNPQSPTSSPIALPQAGQGNAPTSVALPGGFNALPPVIGAIAGGKDWEQLLSVGEKLGMLERAQQPAAPVPTAVTTPVASAALPPGLMAQPTTGNTLRIASFNLNGWGSNPNPNPAVNEVIVRILRQFDVVALQDIRSRRDDTLPDLITHINSSGRKYDFMIGPRVGRAGATAQFAFVFDTERIETDRFQLYTVEDPENLMQREPLVGWFRSRQTDAREAFTFSLVNLQIDGEMAVPECETLPNLVQAIAADGRGEDDIIIAGDFSAAAPQSAFFSSNLYRPLIEGLATTTRGTALVDNLCIPSASTSEYTGRAGALDFLRQYNLSLDQAISVSEHLPVWGEFSIIEGGRPGQVAGNVLPEHRFGGGAN